MGFNYLRLILLLLMIFLIIALLAGDFLSKMLAVLFYDIYYLILGSRAGFRGESLPSMLLILSSFYRLSPPNSLMVLMELSSPSLLLCIKDFKRSLSMVLLFNSLMMKSLLYFLLPPSKSFMASIESIPVYSLNIAYIIYL